MSFLDKLVLVPAVNAILRKMAHDRRIPTRKMETFLSMNKATGRMSLEFRVPAVSYQFEIEVADSSAVQAEVKKHAEEFFKLIQTYRVKRYRA